MFGAILQAWIGAQSICSQFCWFTLWLLGIGEKNVLALEQMTHKPVCWFRYIDDIFFIWPHGKEMLIELLNHLSRLHNKIQFTMEEEEGHLPFLHIDIYRKMDSSLGHRVCQKPTHTSLYLHYKNNQSWLLWYTEPKLAVTRIPSPKNWNLSPPFWMIMDTALSRYEDPWKLHHRQPKPMINPPQLHSYLTPRQHMADSAECWQNTTSEVSVTVFCSSSKM